MTLCPIAIVAGCRKCPIVKVCPVKKIIGDYVEPRAETPKAGGSSKQTKRNAGSKS